MALAELIGLLEARIGLDAESIGTPAIERAIRQRRSACQIADDQAYWNHVRSSEAELQELVETIVVPETWFFRDREALAAVGRLAVQAQGRRPGTPLRLLSLPCSTGEEPYSLAMTLLDAGFTAERFHVDGIDISTRALAAARRAVYGRNSFRGSDLAFRDRYFDAAPHGYVLSERVRRCVEFRQDNLLRDDMPRPEGGYDFVFCRNVLIYFAPLAQQRALRTLHDLLAPGGLIFVGPAETNVMIRHDFVSAKIPLAFAFRATAPADTTPPVSRPSRSARLAVPRSAPVAAPPSAPAPSPKPAARSTVTDVRRLADQGRLTEAAAICDELLRDRSADAEVYYLAGVVQDALGDRTRAIGLYRKAVYLDPVHPEALAHLAYLVEASGDTERAEVLRERARRAREQPR